MQGATTAPVMVDACVLFGTVAVMSTQPLQLPNSTPAFWFATPGPVRSKSNFRRYERKGRSWGEYQMFERDCAFAVTAAVPPDWDLGDKSKALAKRPIVVSAIYATTTLDAGNVPKSVLDACEGIVYHNDASVRCVLVSTNRVSGGTAHVAFAIHTGPMDTAHVLAAQLMDALIAQSAAALAATG